MVFGRANDPVGLLLADLPGVGVLRCDSTIGSVSPSVTERKTDLSCSVLSVSRSISSVGSASVMFVYLPDSVARILYINRPQLSRTENGRDERHSVFGRSINRRPRAYRIRIRRSRHRPRRRPRRGRRSRPLSPERLALERRHAVLRVEVGAVRRPLEIRIDDREVGVGTHLQRPLLGYIPRPGPDSSSVGGPTPRARVDPDRRR